MYLFLRMIFVALFLASLLASARAAAVHKWIDGDGITHYSDKAPPALQATLIQIDLPPSAGVASSDNYHSIANQWARMHRERLERERIELERARLKAAQQPAKAEVVYVERPAASTGHVAVYPVYRYLRHRHRFRPPYLQGHNHSLYKPRVGHGGNRTERNSLGFYKHVQ